MILANITKQTMISDHCHLADSLPKRLVGLLNRSGLNDGEGLLLDRCFGVHTMGMRFTIDVLFLDKAYRVVRAVNSLVPFRICFVPKAVYVIELPAGTILRSQTKTGDQIQVRTTPNGNNPTPAEQPHNSCCRH